MSYTFGIDLGTTNSVVSIYRRGKAETISIEGQKTFPSVISFKDRTTMMAGHQAKKRLLIDPEHSMSSSKRYMGDINKIYKIYDSDYTPVDVASFILKRIVSEANKILSPEDIKDVVITVPAYFNDSQRKDTKEAGKRAGLNVLRLLPEPTAAAIAYGLDKGKDQTIMVYDLGGGTFDITILKVERNNFKVIAVDGDAQLGGDDFDIAVMNYLAGVFKRISGKDILSDKSREAVLARQILKEISEQAKIELSARKKTEINIPNIMNTTFEYELTIDLYNQLISPYIKRTAEKMKEVLKEARMTEADIDRVILVGGSTRNVIVKEVITDLIKEPYICDNVDEVVSHGASIYAASLMTPDKDLAPDIVVTNVIPHSYGIDLIEKHSGKLIFEPIIIKNMEYPAERAIITFTSIAYQSGTLMNVFRGESREPDKNFKLGELVILIERPSQERIPVTASFHLDENGIIYFTAVEFSTVTDREVKLFLEDTLKNYEVDVKRLNGLVRSGKVKSVTVEIKADGCQAPEKEQICEDKKECLIPEECFIPGGTFLMGDDCTMPVHSVTVDSFYMGKYPVTNREYCLFDSSHYNPGDNLPAVCVNWDDAVGYCNWLSKQMGKHYRLPTEAEWEYACRAGSSSDYYWGNTMDGAYCWYDENSGKTASPVGQKKPNAWGLYDMTGNVWEWCSDWFDSSHRVVRGGAWYNDAFMCKSSFRYRNEHDSRYGSYGFRIVRSA